MVDNKLRVQKAQNKLLEDVFGLKSKKQIKKKARKPTCKLKPRVIHPGEWRRFDKQKWGVVVRLHRNKDY